MKSKRSTIWRKNFEIKRASPLLAREGMEAFYANQELTAGKKALRHAFWIQAGVDNTGTYFPKEELREMIDLTIKTMEKNPEKIHRLHARAVRANADLFKLIGRCRKLDLGSYSKKQLAALHAKLYNLLLLSHSLALPTTWFVDSDGEDLTNQLINYVKNRIENLGLKINYARAFSYLTTPPRSSLAEIESIESLSVVEQIKKDKQALELFKLKDPAKIKAGLCGLSPKLRLKIRRHYEKWHWMPYTYLGPAYEIEYYLEVYSTIIKQKIDIKKEQRRLINNSKNNQDNFRDYCRQLKIDPHYRSLFKLAQEIVWLKGYRKDVYYYSCYYFDILFKEIGKRLGLSLNQVRHMTKGELERALLKGKFDLSELNRRLKYFILILDDGCTKILTGDKAKEFLADKVLERITVKNISELTGTPACPGKVKGMVKIVNLPEEMAKMKPGDIMVAHTTFPALVPAMKKAGAIVTDDGGLTCHAAIVARELKKPCVVGAKLATTVLKDGDKVEVDASEGTVRKIK